MVSKNILAALIVAVIIISLTSTYTVLNSLKEEGDEAGTGTVKVEVIEQPGPPSSSGLAIVNVIEKPKGG
ncbi:hypothetical protein GOV06_05285 [Candidatus Woesearchaeota archaeon]|nr:hypothetical protein [Candidatus Woesearchaeota archaeon]